MEDRFFLEDDFFLKTERFLQTRPRFGRAHSPQICPESDSRDRTFALGVMGQIARIQLNRANIGGSCPPATLLCAKLKNRSGAFTARGGGDLRAPAKARERRFHTSVDADRSILAPELWSFLRASRPTKCQTGVQFKKCGLMTSRRNG